MCIRDSLCSSTSDDTSSTLVIDQHILITGVNSVLDQIQQRDRQLLDTDAKLQQSLAIISSLETQIASLRTDITRGKTIRSQRTELQIDHQSQLKTTKAKLQASQCELRTAQSATQHITNKFNALEFKYGALVWDNKILGNALHDSNQEVNRKVKQCRTRDKANSKLSAAATSAIYASLKDQYQQRGKHIEASNQELKIAQQKSKTVQYTIEQLENKIQELTATHSTYLLANPPSALASDTVTHTTSLELQVTNLTKQVQDLTASNVASQLASTQAEKEKASAQTSATKL